MATDLMLIIYPLPMVLRTSLPFKTYSSPPSPLWSLPLTRPSKLELCALFSLGFVIIVISAVRIWALLRHGGLQKWRAMVSSVPPSAAAVMLMRRAVVRVAGAAGGVRCHEWAGVLQGDRRAQRQREESDRWGVRACGDGG